MYHYILTIQWQVPGKVASTGTVEGLINGAGSTSQHVYSTILDAARESFGVPEGLAAAVLVYALRPNVPLRKFGSES